jgi:hypothetical protein
VGHECREEQLRRHSAADVVDPFHQARRTGARYRREAGGRAWRKYVTDGTPTTFESQGTTVSTSAKWMDNALVVVSNVEAVGLSFNDNMTLSADGKTMTSVVRITSPQGDVEMTVVFDRHK